MRRYSPRVFHIASRYFRQRAQVEEVAQEVFLKAYTQLSSYEGRGSFEGWLSRIATNTCLNLLRSAKRRPESIVADLTEDETEWLDNRLASVSAARHESSERGIIAADIAEKALDQMSADDRTVLLMIDGDEMAVKDVAEITGWSESKVKTQAFRARRRMREAVEELFNRKRKS